MDPSVAWFQETKAKVVIAALERNRMSGSYLPDPKDIPAKVMEMIPEGASVGMGGSMTMFETGVVDALRQGPVELIDRYEKDISMEEMMSRFKQGLTADVFVSGVNAVTEYGELVFVDAYCNRVAPILFGPDKVILVTGVNKIVADLEEAQQRIRYMVAPTNTKRLGRKTPCAETGECADCNSPDRICNATVVIHKQAIKDRLHVIMTSGAWGF